MIANQPLVSVGIPTYNRPEGLRLTLLCITSQTYKNLEIIISDNCSPGLDTKKVAHEYIKKDFRIKYICQDKNMGSTFNIKYVLEQATGEYFMWAADDDEWNEYYIESLIMVKANTPYVEIKTEIENSVKGHRLRVVFPTYMKEAKRSLAEVGFGTAERSAGFHPQLNFVSLSGKKAGIAIFNQGIVEYEVKDSPSRDICLTLLKGFFVGRRPNFKRPDERQVGMQ